MALLVAILRGFTRQKEIWRLVAAAGLWRFPRIDVTPQAVYNRLKRDSCAHMEQMLELVTQVLLARFPTPAEPRLAAFATEVVALDRTTLDSVLRRTGCVKDAPATVKDAPATVKDAPGSEGSSASGKRKSSSKTGRAKGCFRSKSKATQSTRLLPGAVSCLYDLRRHYFRKIKFTSDPEQNERVDAMAMIEGLTRGALLLADLGYFGFAWFDNLTRSGYY
jgi:hypothetical protein